MHFGTDEQKKKYLKPMCQGIQRSCFAMTEPEVAGSDPTLIQTLAVRDGDDWVINGHKWFISGAQGAHFAILIARTNPDADIPQDRNTAFIVETELAGLDARARHRDHVGQPQPLRDPHREPARAAREPYSVVWAAAMSWARRGSARRVWRTACAGSVRSRPRSR